jgi:hypothetical protein
MRDVSRIAMTRPHVDGSKCLEGTRRVPRRFEACCELFGGHVDTCVFDLRYEWWQKAQKWVIAVSEHSGITIKYCPHCGKKLKTSARATSHSAKGGTHTRAANNRLQRTVKDKVPKVKRGRPAAEPGRYTARTPDRSGRVHVRFRPEAV